MSLICWSETCVCCSSESRFAVFWLYCKPRELSKNIQRGLFKIFFYDGMFCVGIAAAGMNCFKGSMYNFASVTQWFHLQDTFQRSQSNSDRRTLVHKTFSSLRSKMFKLWFLACSPWNYLDSWKAALLRAFKISENFLPSSKRTVIFKTMHGCLDHPRHGGEIWFQNSYSAHSLFCQSVGLILNWIYKTRCSDLKTDNLLDIVGISWNQVRTKVYHTGSWGSARVIHLVTVACPPALPAWHTQPKVMWTKGKAVYPPSDFSGIPSKQCLNKSSTTADDKLMRCISGPITGFWFRSWLQVMETVTKNKQ